MTRQAYIGINNIARKITKGYIGVNSVARKIKKVYVGVNNIAKICWNFDIPYCYGKVPDVSLYAASVTTDNHALFGGGMYAASPDSVLYQTNSVYSFNNYLTKESLSSLSNISSYLAGANVGNYALFAGGYSLRQTSGGTVYYTGLDTVDAYDDSSLTKTTVSSLSTGRGELAGASIGNYALFAGGGTANNRINVTNDDEINAYNISLTRSSPSSLFRTTRSLGGASVGNYALFAGGYAALATAYNRSLTRSSTTSLSVPRKLLVGTSVGNYALFAGGMDTRSSEYYSTVEAYDTSLTRIIPDELSNVGLMAGTTSKGFAVYAGNGVTNLYDENLVRTEMNPVPNSRFSMVGANVGDYALFIGGIDSSNNYYDDLYAYTI